MICRNDVPVFCLSMNPLISELRRVLARWRVEHVSVAAGAYARNLERMHVLCPIVAVINGLHALVFLFQLVAGASTGQAHQWIVGLFILHVTMGLMMVAFTLAARKLLRSPHARWAQALSLLVVAVAMLFAIAIVAADQWITPNITPYLVACTVIGLAFYARPVPAALVYLISYCVFFYAIGETQSSVPQLLSNRLNGLAISTMGWILSVMMWRHFTTITLQQEQLTRVNAELQQKQRELERLTRQDGLTGLFNRNTFVELAKQELDRAQRQGSATAILLLDLDHFKLINDTWGHPAGDAVLRNVALVASATVRSTDLVGRLGGEEFVVLLPGTTLDAARKLAEKLRMRLQASPTPWESSAITATASIGMAGTSASEKRSFDALYNEADKALYIAKLRGRNRVEP